MGDEIERVLDAYELAERNRVEAIAEARRAAEQFDDDFVEWAEQVASPTLEAIAEQFRARQDFDAEVRAERRAVRFSFRVQQCEGPVGRQGEVAFAPDTGSRSVTVRQVTFNRTTEERRPLSDLSADALREQIVIIAKNALDL
jgi:hypothetical protein